MDYRGLLFGITRVLVSVGIGFIILYITKVLFRRADKR